MIAQSFLDGRVVLHPGNCLDVLAELPANSVDAVVSDPPYHLTSIVDRFGDEGAAPAKAKQTGAFSRAAAGFMGKAWDGGDIAFRVETWKAVQRVLKPGGYILAFASSRGFGRMSVAIEDAGFITHPMIGWIFGSGFPKATRVQADGYEGQRYGGQSLKPAIEPIYMGQKPFSEKTGTANILRWGTGAVNIDACRVDAEAGRPLVVSDRRSGNQVYGDGLQGSKSVEGGTNLGRWPANVIHDGSPEVVNAFPQAPGQQREVNDSFAPKAGTIVYGDYGPRPTVSPRDGGGSAARFFYAAKADADDRIGSKHPTVKPLDLMQYLVRLVTPKGGTVLDPFAGTGTTGEAAFREGRSAVLIEREAEYQTDIARRMALATAGPLERSYKRNALKPAEEAGPLFDLFKAPR